MNIPEHSLRHWTRMLSEETFESEEAARTRIFEICERHDNQSWSTSPEEITIVKNRAFARAFPVHNAEGKWRVGLAEYLSNNTSDFSDGTNGEPTGYPPSGGGAGSNVGVPDYKYLDKQKQRHARLKVLRQRRDPEKLSRDSFDASIGESSDSWIGPVFHASPNQFERFDTSREGAHFGTHEQASNLRKSGKLAPKAYFISLKNPLRMRDIGVWNNFNNFHTALSIEDFITPEQADAAWAAWQQTDEAGWSALKQALEQNGHDGIAYENEQEGSGDSYLVFRPEQIKPAETGRQTEAQEDDFEDNFDVKDLISSHPAVFTLTQKLDDDDYDAIGMIDAAYGLPEIISDQLEQIPGMQGTYTVEKPSKWVKEDVYCTTIIFPAISAEESPRLLQFMTDGFKELQISGTFKIA